MHSNSAAEHATDFTARGLESVDPVEATVEIDAAAEVVWQVISAPGYLADVHPFCATNDVERWPGPGSLDHVQYYSGIHYQRACLAWEEGSGYLLAVGPPAGATALVTWSITPIGEDRCRLAINILPFVRQDVPPPDRSAYVAEVIESGLPPYLDSVVRGVRHVAESGQPVERNQFGSHPIFSPDAA